MISGERDKADKIPILNEFIEQEIEHFTARVKGYEVTAKPETSPLEELFRSPLMEVGPGNYLLPIIPIFVVFLSILTTLF